MKELVKSHLNQIGIDSVKELAKRVPQATLDKIIEFNKNQPNVIRRLLSTARQEEVFFEDYLSNA